MNDVYYDITDDRNWSWARDTFTGSTSTSDPYVALPADFDLILPNLSSNIGYGYTNLGVPHGSSSLYSQRIYTPYALNSVVFVGTTNSVYKVIDIAKRNNYLNMDGYCYVDIPN